MRTVIETPTFQKQAGKIWSEEERMAFMNWIAEHPTAGDVIPGTDGARKVRWSVAGTGKSGGIRVIYFNLTEQGTVVLITLYQKAEQAHIQPNDIKKAL
ncbi:MAG: DNA-binding protein [Candidatus Competibacter sp.]|nr:DNA-binding protein [Candidatus Competibacter sp.]MDG4584726.1 DNA-binding protein [Candidatus Competibacter sp.]